MAPTRREPESLSLQGYPIREGQPLSLWNTVYLDHTITNVDSNDSAIDPDLLRLLSPLGWEHSNLTGDYIWTHGSHIQSGLRVISLGE